MIFLVAGTNHRTGSMYLRERLSCTTKGLKRLHASIADLGIINGAVVVSTCNRMEIYAAVENNEDGIEALIDFFSSYYNIARKRLREEMYFYYDRDAISHLCSVYAGLDSLIVGEKQIVSQLDEAFSLANTAGITNTFIEDIFYFARKTKNRVHLETNISRGKVSVGSVAVEFLRKKKGSLRNKNILMIGLGEVSELVLKYLVNERPSLTLAANRNYEKAIIVASKINAKVVKLDDLKPSINKADIIITATSSPHIVLKSKDIEGIDKEIFIVDLAFPRDVDPEVGKLLNVELIHMEDLKEIIKGNLEMKSSAAEKAREIILSQVKNKWRTVLELVPEPALLP